MDETVIAPIFPLDSALLVPGGLMPLHVFEPRYRAMVSDAMAGDRRIAMALPRLGHSASDEERPPVHEVCGLGVIVHHEPLPDGRSSIVLHGRRRVRILEEIDAGKPYRVVRGVTLRDVTPVDEDLGPRARALLDRLAELTDEQRANLEALPPGRLVDAVLSGLPVPARDRHRVYSRPDVAWRLREVEVLIDLVQGSRYRTDLPADDPRMN